MDMLIFVIIFLLGTIIGSFLNVVIYRFNTGRTIVKGRSICMTCQRTLRWYELIPVLSYIMQSGKCRRCKEVISYQYPLVELLTGFVFTLIAYHFSPILYFSPAHYLIPVLLFVFIFSILIVIAVYDIRHKIIPDKLVYVYVIATLISTFVNYSGVGSLFVWPHLPSLLAGPVLAAPFALIWLVSRGKWMGLGDAKLMLGIGFMLGPSLGLASLFLSFWIGAVVSIFIMFFTRKKVTMKTEIPFAPFLIISSLLVFLLNLDVVTLSSWIHF